MHTPEVQKLQAGLYRVYNKYNPQNEMFVHFKTKRYLRKTKCIIFNEKFSTGFAGIGNLFERRWNDTPTPFVRLVAPLPL